MWSAESRMKILHLIEIDSLGSRVPLRCNLPVSTHLSHWPRNHQIIQPFCTSGIGNNRRQSVSTLSNINNIVVPSAQDSNNSDTWLHRSHLRCRAGASSCCDNISVRSDCSRQSSPRPIEVKRPVLWHQLEISVLRVYLWNKNQANCNQSHACILTSKAMWSYRTFLLRCYCKRTRTNKGMFFSWTDRVAESYRMTVLVSFLGK